MLPFNKTIIPSLWDINWSNHVTIKSLAVDLAFQLGMDKIPMNYQASWIFTQGAT